MIGSETSTAAAIDAQRTPPDRSFDLRPPSPLAPLGAAGISLAATLGLAAVASAGFTGNLGWPALVDGRWRLVLGAACLAAAIAGVGAASSGFLRAWDLLRYRLDGTGILETEGPARIVHERADLWGLELSLSSDPIPWSGGPTVARPPGDGGTRAECRIFFPLDEAAAATLCRFFQPWETLILRWLDRPVSSGGPVLLHVEASAAAGQLDAAITEIGGPDPAAAELLADVRRRGDGTPRRRAA
jgi:hypothetical protein